MVLNIFYLTISFPENAMFKLLRQFSSNPSGVYNPFSPGTRRSARAVYNQIREASGKLPELTKVSTQFNFWPLKSLNNEDVTCWSVSHRDQFPKFNGKMFQDRYPHVQRGEYALLSNSHLSFFKDLLGVERVITDPSECEGYNIDWIKNVRGNW